MSGARPMRGARSSAGADPFVFGGRLLTADGGSPVGLRVVAADARSTAEAIIDSSGMFVGSFSAPPVGPVTLRVFDDPSAHRYHTSTVTLGARVLPTSLRIVMIPTTWRIRGGTFDGRVVTVDPGRATARAPGAAGYWRLTRRGWRTGRPVSWANDSLPLRLAFRHAPGDPTISVYDSARVWELARALEQTIGRSVFRPGSFAEIDGGADGILVTINHGMSAAGRTFITYDESGRIFEALVTVHDRSLLGDPRVLLHELLHAIGLGHTAEWSSVMSPTTRRIETPTADDIAYAQLYLAVSAIQRATDAPFGIRESVSR